MAFFLKPMYKTYMEGLEPALKSATREELLAEIVRLAAVNSEQADQIALQTEEIERLKAAVEELQRRLDRPKKDSANSSVPPSREEKENKKPKEKKKRKKRGFGSAWMLSENPDEIKDIKADSCSHCHADLSAQPQSFSHAREKTEVIIETHITQARMYECRCPHCGKRTVAKAPEGFRGSPFGTSVEALILLLHYTHAMSYKRLEEFLGQMFSLKTSQGAIRNIIKRSQGKFEKRREEIKRTVRGSPVVCSDETGSRVEGSKWWEWVFVSMDAVLHVLRPSRGRVVVEEVMGEYEPGVWVSDLYGAQLGHGKKHQMCLAHQIRDLKYAVECGDKVFAPGMRELLCEAMEVGSRRDNLCDAELEEYLREFERRIDELLLTEPVQEDAVRLRNRYVKHRDALFVFMKNRDVPYTNNVSERAIRMSKMFLKVTNGFRSQWGADMFGAVRSVINTGSLHGLSPYESILATIEGRCIIPT